MYWYWKWWLTSPVAHHRLTISLNTIQQNTSCAIVQLLKHLIWVWMLQCLTSRAMAVLIEHKFNGRTSTLVSEEM